MLPSQACVTYPAPEKMKSQRKFNMLLPLKGGKKTLGGQNDKCPAQVSLQGRHAHDRLAGKKS